MSVGPQQGMPRDLYRPKTAAVVGAHLPRRCGVGAFTAEFCTALAEELGKEGNVFALAVDDIPEGHKYPPRVKFQLRMNEEDDYVPAADFINLSQADVVILQHDFGIYGGPAGSHILRLVRELGAPLLTTLHSLPTEPSKEHRRVTTELGRASDFLVVMSRRAFDLLAQTYKVPYQKILFIPHGIPDVPFIDPIFHKDRFEAEDRRVLLSFGLLSPDKGIEYAIQAMPAIMAKHPEALYVCLGAAHPQARKAHGQEYRETLKQMTADLGVGENVRLQGGFVDMKELCEYLCAADICVMPYLNETQTTSGTLAYALGAGKAVVSTPFPYAAEMLDEGRGMLVPFRNSEAIAQAVIEVLENDGRRDLMRKRGYQYCREMVWRQVARFYLLAAQQAIQERAHKPAPLRRQGKPIERAVMPPEINLEHLRTLTDDTGVLHEALWTTPNRNPGYRTEDNARALVIASMHWQLRRDESVRPLFRTYLSFLAHAFNEQMGRFRNQMRYDRQWADEAGSEESHGRAIQGLGTASAHGPGEGLQIPAALLFQQALPACEAFLSPQAWAYSLLGIHSYLARYGGDVTARQVRNSLAEKLFGLFRKNARRDWPWCEDVVAHGNPSLPHALLLAGQWIPNGELSEQGLRSLRWLLEVQTSKEGHLSVIGNQGWFVRGRGPARFDQQPAEASELAQACCEAYAATQDEQWLGEARRCLEWFLGRNDLNTPVYDDGTGGCCDALRANGPSANQGAEATLSWLAALLGYLAHEERRHGRNAK